MEMLAYFYFITQRGLESIWNFSILLRFKPQLPLIHGLWWWVWDLLLFYLYAI